MRKTTLVSLLTVSPLYAMLWGQIVNIEDKRSSFTDTTAWHETLDLGFNWIKNNSNILNLSGAAQIESQNKNRMILSITSFKYVVINDQHFVNEGFQHLRYNNSLRKKLTFEIFAQAQFNEQLKLKLRALAGTGLRFTLINKAKAKTFLGTSIM